MELDAQLSRMSRTELILTGNKIRTLLQKEESTDGKFLWSIIHSTLVKETGSTRTNPKSVTSQEMSEALKVIDNLLIKFNITLTRKQTLILYSILCEEAVRVIRSRKQQLNGKSIVHLLGDAFALVYDSFPGYSRQALLLALKQRAN